MPEIHIWRKFSSYCHLQCLVPLCGAGSECTRGQYRSFHMQSHQEIWSRKEQAPSSCLTVQGAADAKAVPGHSPPPDSFCSGGSWHQHGCPMPRAFRGDHVFCGSANLAAAHEGFCTSWGWESLCCFYMFAWCLKRAVLLGLITAMSSSPGRISHTSRPPRGTQLRDVLQEP